MDLNVCIVDSERVGFQCSREKGPASFIRFEDGKDLECLHPQDAEQFLKACDDHWLLAVPDCSYTENQFECTNGKTLTLHLANNFVCLSSKEYRRLKERCTL